MYNVRRPGVVRLLSVVRLPPASYVRGMVYLSILVLPLPQAIAARVHHSQFAHEVAVLNIM
jgi:hypothetical protein